MLALVLSRDVYPVFVSHLHETPLTLFFIYSFVLLQTMLFGQVSDTESDTLEASSEADEVYYILPDFVVTDDQDKGYYSANTLAGTRTNELTKNIPMTISTVNEAMIEDFAMKTLADLGNFVPGIEAEENVYNNQEIRFEDFYRALNSMNSCPVTPHWTIILMLGVLMSYVEPTV